MRFRWLLLLSSFLSILIFSTAAGARELTSWRFNRQENRLEFRTDAGVQPKAQLIFNPTRVVIDLPQISLGRGRTLNQRVGGAIKEIRVGQLDKQTTRIVIELAPGYTLDPDKVKFRGITASEWTVDLPDPERISPSSNLPPQEKVMLAAASITRENRATKEDSPLLDEQSLPSADAGELATIESVELSSNQLFVRADRSLNASSTWDRAENAFRITIPGAKLADRVRGPQLDADSPVSQVLLRQQDSRTVVILVKPGRDTQIGELNQLTDRLLALQLQRTPATAARTASSPIPVPLPERSAPVLSPRTPVSLPRLPNGRIVVAIDPGHGGKDPGTIGIGGVQEKNVILPIAMEVAALLEQQGVQTMLTRSSDYFVSLEGRVQMASRARANLFVSIHANAISLGRPDVNGIETYYYASGQGLAQTIHKSILQNVDVADRRVRRARFYVLRRSAMPAVLVEVGFLTGREDSLKLASPAYRHQMAQAIALGILQYIQQRS